MRKGVAEIWNEGGQLGNVLAALPESEFGAELRDNRDQLESVLGALLEKEFLPRFRQEQKCKAEV